MTSFHYPAKVIRPQPGPGTLIRPRVHALLESGSGASVIWLAGPPGAGKTTLVSSYVAQSGESCLWYQIDAGDADPATFFHYMGLAARQATPRVKQSLPHLTPEYLPNLPVFTQRYFEDLYGRLKRPAVLVFDNYQEVGADTALHAVMAQALAALPPGVRVIVISREDPPPPLARLRATQTLVLLGWDAIRLTADESASIARLRNPDLAASTLSRLYAQTQGWAAGLVLALERDDGGDAGENEQGAPQAVFDYFAEEIFAGMAPQAQQVLLRCAFLPRVSAADAERLTGIAHAGQVLADLNARGYFTLRHAATGFQLHPLFQAFLRTRALRTFDAATLSELHCRAAALLEQQGEIAAAVELLIAAGAWEAVMEVLARHARELLRQGRASTLEKWLRQAPEERSARDPWLLYWLGQCRLPVSPVEARGDLEAAYRLFEIQGDMAGLALAWAAIVDSFIFEWGDFGPLDPWIAAMDELFAHSGGSFAPEIEARIACGMFSALVWRQPQRADVAQWAERTMRIFMDTGSVELKMALSNILLLYFVLMGDFSKAALIIEDLRPLIRARGNTPLIELQWWVSLAMYSWFAGDNGACFAAIAEGERLAETTGIHLLSANLYAQGVYAAVTQGDVKAATAMLEKVRAVGFATPIVKALYHYQAASVYWLSRDLPHSRQHGEIAADIADRAGAPIPAALINLELAVTLSEMGEHEAADAALARGAAIGGGMNYMQFMRHIYGAHFARQRGRLDAALAESRAAFGLAARMGYLNLPRWNVAMMGPLCALALEHGIEVDYVLRLIRLRAIPPASGAARHEAWPWAVRIRALGEFALQVDGQDVDLAGRDRRRPAEVLKALVALGGRRVNAARLTDLLWPDAEGDAGYQALHTNLHRLRKLLGKDVLRSDAGGLSLDEQQVWVDTWAVADLLTRIESAGATPPTASAADAERLMQLYMGPLFPNAGQQAWAFAERNRLHERMIRAVEALGQVLEEHAQWDTAAKLYEWAVETVDPVVESFYMGAMRAQHRLGHPARLARLYQRCRATLAALLETVPSPAVEGLFAALKETPADRHS